MDLNWINTGELQKVVAPIQNVIPDLSWVWQSIDFTVVVPSLFALGILFLLLRTNAGEYPAAFLGINWVIRLIPTLNQPHIAAIAFLILAIVGIIDKAEAVTHLWRQFLSKKDEE